MNRKQKIKRYFIPVAIIIFIATIVYDYRHLVNLHEEYRVITKADSLSGIIENITSNKGTNFLMVNGEKVIIGASSNELYPIPNINRIMVQGDSITKESNSDSIFLYHDNLDYHFIIDKVINKKTILNR